MTRRTDHIRAVALALAQDHKLTARRLGDMVHIGDRQAYRWIGTLLDEGTIVPCGTETTQPTGRPSTLYTTSPP
jgi:predicted ArsR family transcriptional regulator